LNSKLHAVCDSEGRPRSLFLTAAPLSAMQASPYGQRVSDYTGAAALLSTLPPAKALLADKGYDADWFRYALADRNIEACIPSKSNKKIQIPHDKALYRKRHNLLGHEDMPCQAMDRKHVRQDEGLANRLENSPPDCFLTLLIHPHPLRPLRPHLHVRHRNCRNRHLLDMINES
jgi:transposase